MHIEWLHLTFSYSFLIVGEILFLSALLHMVYQRRSPTSMISWLLAIILLPHLAVPLYFILGSRKRTSSKVKSMFNLRSVTDLPLEEANPIDGVLRANGIPGGTQGNRFSLYTDGTEAYSALLQEIEKAQESIFISTYVFNSDAVTARILKALAKKAREGKGWRSSFSSTHWAHFLSTVSSIPSRNSGRQGPRSHFSCPSCRCRFETTSTCATTGRSISLTGALS